MRNVPVIAIVLLLGCHQAKHDPKPTLKPVMLKSAGLDPDRDPERIAFGSCFAPQIGKDAIWQGVLSQSPDLLLLLGDNVYQTEENGKPELKELRDAYRMLAAVEAFTQLRANTPLMMTWDDHDYGMNDAGSEFSAKTQSQELFLEIWAVPPDDQRRQRDGIYYAQTIGQPGHRIQIIVLDTRYFRSPYKRSDDTSIAGQERYMEDPDPHKTLLGEAQWQWLEQRLLEPADVRLLVSSIQLLADGHGYECWRMLPLERQRLFDLIATTGANGLVVLSGDRHVAGYYRRSEGLPYAITELTASPFNMVIEGQGLKNTLNEPGPRRLGELVGVENFGVVTFEWERSVLGLEIRDQAGALVRREEIDITDLKSPHEEPGGTHP